MLLGNKSYAVERLFISLLKGATFVKSVQFWEEQQSQVCGLCPWKICQLFDNAKQLNFQWVQPSYFALLLIEHTVYSKVAPFKNLGLEAD